MLEDVRESDKLKVCNLIWETMSTDEREELEQVHNKQSWLEGCVEKGIKIVEENEDGSRTLKLAESITRMADSLDELLKTGINRKLLILFIHDQIGREIGKTKIEMVLEAIEEFIKETRKGG